MLFTGAPAPTSTVAIVERPPSDHLDTDTSSVESSDLVSPRNRVELEIVHLSGGENGKNSEATLRKVSLFADQKANDDNELEPLGGKHRKKRKGSGEDTSITGTARVIGPRLLTAVLQANGYCRLFETDATSLEKSASTWRQMKGEIGAQQQGSWGITRLRAGDEGDIAAAAAGKAHATANAGKRDKDGWSIPKNWLRQTKAW